MRTAKRWTNATFTKRVDHQVGKRAIAAPELVLCPACRMAAEGQFAFSHENKFAHVTWSRDR